MYPVGLVMGVRSRIRGARLGLGEAGLGGTFKVHCLHPVEVAAWHVDERSDLLAREEVLAVGECWAMARHVARLAQRNYMAN